MSDCRKIFLVIAFCCAALNAKADQGCHKTIGYVEEFPFATVDAEKRVQGINIDLINEAFRRMGCEAQYFKLPVQRGMMYLQFGTVDMYAGVIKTEERTNYAYYSIPFTRSPMYIYLANKSQFTKRPENLADLIGTDLRIGVLSNRAFGTEFLALSKNPDFAKLLNPIDSQDSIWRMMAVGRLDATISDALAANSDLSRLRLSNAIHRSSIVVSNEADYVAFSKKTTDTAFVDQFNAAYTSMQNDGSFKKIWQSYIPCQVSVKSLGCE